jgi:hypothetical protein
MTNDKSNLVIFNNREIPWTSIFPECLQLTQPLSLDAREGIYQRQALNSWCELERLRIQTKRRKPSRWWDDLANSRTFCLRLNLLDVLHWVFEFLFCRSVDWSFGRSNEVFDGIRLKGSAKKKQNPLSCYFVLQHYIRLDSTSKCTRYASGAFHSTITCLFVHFRTSTPRRCQVSTMSNRRFCYCIL